jgi:hypothetical protein
MGFARERPTPVKDVLVEIESTSWILAWGLRQLLVWWEV